MKSGPPALLSLVWRTVTSPREAAETILSLGLPRQVLWMALALLCAVSAILGALMPVLVPQPPPVEGAPEPIVVPPLLFAAMMFVATALYAWLLGALGRQFRGSGRFDEALALLVFLQFALLVAEVPQILLMAAAPPLAAVYFLAILILAIWVNVQFVDVLHGYGSLLKSVVLIFAVSALLAIALMTLLTLSGVGLEAR